MRFFIALLCFLVTAQYAEAPYAQAGDVPRVQIVEGEVTGETTCTALPSSADIARILRETLSRRLGREVSAVARAAKTDAAALKIAVDLSLTFYTDNFDDGPIRIVGVIERMWQGTTEEPPPDPELYGLEDRLECDEFLTDFVTRIVRRHAQRLADESMVR